MAQAAPGPGNTLIEARENARLKALQAIKAAGERDWRAHAEWLKLAFADDYRGTPKIDVSATAVFSPLVMTEDRRLELIERRRQLGMGPKPDPL